MFRLFRARNLPFSNHISVLHIIAAISSVIAIPSSRYLQIRADIRQNQSYVRFEKKPVVEIVLSVVPDIFDHNVRS
ncbi:hypothetical protein MRB53_037844 [Persea americana]|nr:hypothetical protein MRB53_037844 [Persea americana]